MNKRPSLQFYPNDWIGDAELSMCSAITRGIWITALCRMWHSKNCGTLTGTKAQMCRILACNEDEFAQFEKEILQTNFGNLTVSNKIITLTNRRMAKDEKIRKSNAERQKRHYKKAAQSQKVKPNKELTAPSSTSSSSSNKEKHTKEKIHREKFDDARRKYIGIKRGLETEFNNFRKKHIDWESVLPLLRPAIDEQIKRRKIKAQTGQFVPPWKHFATWINKRCWTETEGVTESQEERVEKERQKVEKYKQKIREEKQEYLEDKTTAALLDIKEDGGHLWKHSGWLIQEILDERKLKG